MQHVVDILQTNKMSYLFNPSNTPAYSVSLYARHISPLCCNTTAQRRI